MKEGAKHYLKIILNLVIVCITILFVVWFLPKMIGFFVPFVVGGIIAVLANPIVHFLEKRLKIRRKAGSVFTVVLVIGLVALVLYGAIRFLTGQMVGFLNHLPDMLQATMTDLSNLGKSLQGVYDRLPTDMKMEVGNMGQKLTEYFSGLMTKISTPTVAWVGNFAMSVPNLIVSVVMCLLSSYFFIVEHDSTQLFWQKHMPVFVKNTWEIILSSFKKSFGGYLLAQLRIELWMYLLLVIGLTIAGIRYVILVAFVIAFLDLLPVFGTGTVLIPWAFIKLIGADYKTAVILLILWGGGQLLRQLIQPHFVGDSLGMPILPTLFLLYIGWKIGGVGGMIIAVPIGLVVVNLYQAGLFDTTRDSMHILIQDINAFRKYNETDYKYYKHYFLTKDSQAEDNKDEGNKLSDRDI